MRTAYLQVSETITPGNWMTGTNLSPNLSVGRQHSLEAHSAMKTYYTQAKQYATSN